MPTRDVTPPLRRPPSSSIRARLQQALLAWALLWCVALGLAVWLAVREEVVELLDDTLQSTAEGLILPLAQLAQLASAGSPLEPAAAVAQAAGARASMPGQRFAWQQVQHGASAQVLRRSPGAPVEPLRAAPTPGFSDAPGWRVYGLAPGLDGQMIYVAQTRAERGEAVAEVGFAVLLAGLPMALLGLVWLGWRVRQELLPLQALSLRLAAHDPLQPDTTLGTATHAELQPVNDAIDALSARLARRVAQERAFAAHAAHALRTPLAGIDAQLAVALREAPEALQPRLARVRAAAARLQGVVAGLLAFFRSGGETHPEPLHLQALAARLALPGLELRVLAQSSPQALAADVDLITAALLNLLDNALRHGANIVTLSTPQPQWLRVHDNGRGCPAEPLALLRSALDAQDYAGRTGLGLMLADLVARAHGGRLVLPATDHGFVVELQLGAASPNS